MSRPRPSRWRSAAVNIGIVAALLFAASFLPPDTSLADRQRAGVIKLCVPPSFPPLVTSDPSAPGYDIELGQALAAELGLRLAVNTVPSIGRDYNPRNWSLTRAQCDLVGGGVADSVQTRSFMQTLPTQTQTGWIGISRTGAMPAAGSVVAVLPGTSGLSRVTLSSWLRARNYRGKLVRDTKELAQALTSGEASAVITERFLAAGLELDERQYQSFWLDEPQFEGFPMALGLWKGDQTFKSAVAAAFETIERSGRAAQLRERYGIDAEPQ
ncbi:MAG TPA: transporter substrate-binding domain-containing protein [Devosia sp.]|jgi:ABC-type amino acid transport substrate-binding protein|uniref:substrate-binding periplasmic protein n=1 Tax=Devosia sp. TaxID=1871048 RepID=UPI002F955548